MRLRSLAVVVLVVLKCLDEFPILSRQVVCLGDEVEGFVTKFVLKRANICRESVFARNFRAHWEVVDFLIFVQPLI